MWFCWHLLHQLQQEEAQKIRDRRANEAALAALNTIGSGTKRKRPPGADGVRLQLPNTHIFCIICVFEGI